MKHISHKSNERNDVHSASACQEDVGVSWGMGYRRADRLLGSTLHCEPGLLQRASAHEGLMPRGGLMPPLPIPNLTHKWGDGHILGNHHQAGTIDHFSSSL